MPDRRVPTRVVGSVDADVDGERVVLSPKDYAYFGMKGAGARVWDLVDGSRTVDDIVEALKTEFEASDETIRAETLAFLDALVTAGLVADLGPPPAGN